MLTRYLLAITLIGSAAFGAQQPLEQAWDLAAHGKSADAIQLLRSLVRKEPANADARLLLGSLLMESNQQAESIEQLKSGVRLRLASSEAHNALGEAYKKFGQLEQARSEFNQAITLKPDYGIGLLNLGQTLLALEKPNEAEAPLRRATRLLAGTEDAADAHYLLAKVSLTKGLADAAEPELEKAVQIRPNFPQAWSDLGQVRKGLSDNAGAFAAFRRAVEQNPADPVAAYRLGSQYLSQGDAHSAIIYLQKARELNPQDQSVLNALQLALRKDGRPDEAAEVKRALSNLLRQADLTNQSHLSAIRLNNQGADLEKSGDLSGALKLYDQAATLYPEHAGIRFNYGVALLRTGQWTAGLNQLYAAQERDPQNAKIRATLSDALAQAPRDLIPSGLN